MVSFFLKRLVTAGLLLFLVSVISFVLISLSPGNVAQTILGENATPEAVSALIEELDLDAPLPQQYWQWLTAALHGDFGSSLLNNEPVTQLLSGRVEPTISLVVLTLLVKTVLGSFLGITSALRGGSTARIVDSLGMLGFAIPGFIVGILLISVFAVWLRWLPVGGYAPLSAGVWDWLSHLILPVAALAVGGVGFLAKQMRAAMTDSLQSEYVRTLTGNGFHRRSIVLKHTLRNAAVPAIAMIGLQVVAILGGLVLIESVFGIPGLGGAAVQATTQKDLPVVQAVVVIFAVIVVVTNLLLDVLYVAVNPRVRIS